MINEYNSLLSNNFYYLSANNKGKRLEEITNQLKINEQKLSKLNIKIKGQPQGEIISNLVISKIKYNIKETKKDKFSTKNIYQENKLIIQTNKNEGFFFINDYYSDQYFTCESSDSIEFYEIKCDYISTNIYKKKNI